jgi:N utilization substance protein B
MAAVDRNLLRLGLYELMFQKEIPFPIVINEALEIVKEFSDQEGTQFLNGILDAARKEFRAGETGARQKAKEPKAESEHFASEPAEPEPSEQDPS